MKVKIGQPKGADLENPENEGAENQLEQHHVELIDKAISEIQSGDTQGAVSTLEELKTGEAGEIEPDETDETEKKPTMEDGVNAMFAKGNSPMSSESKP
jgi:hypothetical protein